MITYTVTNILKVNKTDVNSKPMYSLELSDFESQRIKINFKTKLVQMKVSTEEMIPTRCNNLSVINKIYRHISRKKNNNHVFQDYESLLFM